MADEKSDGISSDALKTVAQVVAIGALVAGGAAQASAIRSDLNNLMNAYRADMSNLQRRLDKADDMASRLTVLEREVSRDREDQRNNSAMSDRRLTDIQEQLRRLETLQRRR